MKAMAGKAFPRWLPTAVGIAVLAFGAVAAARLGPGDDRSGTLPPPEPAFTLPGVTSGPQIPVSLLPSTPPVTGAGTGAGTGAAGTLPAGDITGQPPATRGRPPAAVTAPRTTAAPRTVAPTGVTGTYRVVESYPDSFIGEVLVRNPTGSERSWRVTLSYPGELVTSWLESLPQPTLARRGNTYTWTSSVPLAARSSGSLRFHFKLSGSAGPSGCTVDGSPCR
ncbi:hypothetical protein GCM10010172_84500 [Paractinoplanes ferrugineus]|uniref:CBM2 domain-containing protein n=1 Tax=Paractinoplanes ferrugineus TaxID=113564 RepID=A0A919M8R9_9ACTN|nr:hypothetical protein [Actinoplanes ferrugineus]GIE10771.1 hypothetical protein Afe05nite_26110 [Actinoplanes ferrugineus]